MTKTQDDYITTSEAARILGLTTRTIQGLCFNGKIKAKKFGFLWMISKKSILEYKKRC